MVTCLARKSALMQGCCINSRATKKYLTLYSDTEKS